MTRRVLVDTSALYAFVTATDPHHAEAREFVKDLIAGRGLLVLADLVFAETMTLLKGRLGGAVAVRVGRELRSNPLYAWVALGTEGERETWMLFQRFADKEWSYVDCALLVLARRFRIKEIFTFDRHFEQMPGVKRVPEP